MKIPLSLGPSYLRESLNEIQKTVNFFVQKNPDESYCLVSLPGLELLDTVANNAGCRGALMVPYLAAHRVYSVHGNTVYLIDGVGADTSVGTLGSSSGRVSMASSPTHIVIVDGTDGRAVDIAGGTTAQIVDANFPANPGYVTFKDSRFIVNDRETGLFYLSELDSATDWTPVRAAEAEEYPDAIAAVVSSGNYLFLVGIDTTEAWMNTGNASFTYERVTGAVYNIGTLDGKSVAQFNNRVFMVGRNDGGLGSVWMFEGLNPIKISTPDIEKKIKVVAQNGEVFGYCWNYQGNEFYRITFPTGGLTLEYNVSSQSWHQVKSVGVTHGRAAMITAPYTSSGLYPIAFDTENGKVYRVNADYSTEDGDAKTLSRDFGPIEAGANLIFHHKLRLDMEVKYDSTASPTLSATLAKSDNAGQSFDSGVTLSRALTSATTAQRVPLEARRLGSSRERYYRLTMSPAARVVLKLAELDAEMGAH